MKSKKVILDGNEFLIPTKGMSQLNGYPFREFVFGGKFERYECRWLRKYMTKDSVCLDAGANVGQFSVIMAKRCRKVYAVEPEPENFELLAKNTEKFDNIVCIEGGLADHNRTKFLRGTKKRRGGWRLKAR